VAISTDSDMVIVVAPELEGTNTDRIDQFIEWAKNSVDESVWGDNADYATALLAAHMLTVANKRGIGGETKRKKLGDTEIEFATMGAAGNQQPHELTVTSYGKEFLRVRRTLQMGPLVAGGCT